MTTISHEEVRVLAPDVPPKAQGMKGLKNPFISFESLDALCQGNETLEDCLRDMVTYSLRYAETVCRFEQVVARGQESNMDGTRAEIEQIRGTVHDATIASINILIRVLKKAGKDTTWSSKMVTGGRAAYGKLAILIAFEYVLRKEVYRGQ
jgi:hypothetical protein